MTDKDEVAAVKPCPFCKSNHTILSNTGVHWVNCLDCGCEGPVCDTEEDTIDAWNTRASAAPGEPCAVKVKPLEWVNHSPRGWLAQSIFGTYRIYEYSAGVEWFSTEATERLQFSSLDEAKAAAQADYEQRIRSALLTTPQPVAGWDEAIEASASLLDKKAEMFASLHANALDDHQREDYERRRLNVEAWAKEVRSLRREAPAPAFDLTNHHNALKCPYCNPEGLTFARPDTAEARLRELLSEARQYVADAGDDEDGETKQLSSQLLAEIDKALSAGDEK